MIAALANPHRFMAFSKWAAPLLGAAAALATVCGVMIGFTTPEDYQQGDTIRILFIHVPSAWMSMAVYAALGGASFVHLVFRHSLADAAAKAAAPIGAGYTALALVTGSLWGQPSWGTWWVWDARLTSVLVLLFLYLSYMALRAAIDDEGRSARAGAILALVGLINLPIIKFSVDWWNTLHQGSSVFSSPGAGLAPVYRLPLYLTAAGYLLAFGSLWLVRIRAEVWRRRAGALALAMAAGR